MKKARRIIVDTETGEVIGAQRNGKTVAVVILSVLVAFFLAVCLCYMRVNWLLAQENIGLSQSLYETEQRYEKEIAGLNAELEEERAGDIETGGSSYDRWKALYDAGAIEETYEQWKDITGQQGFSVREYAEAKDEWNKMHEAGKTDLSFDEWSELLE